MLIYDLIRSHYILTDDRRSAGVSGDKQRHDASRSLCCHINAKAMFSGPVKRTGQADSHVGVVLPPSPPPPHDLPTPQPIGDRRCCQGGVSNHNYIPVS